MAENQRIKDRPEQAAINNQTWLLTDDLSETEVANQSKKIKPQTINETASSLVFRKNFFTSDFIFENLQGSSQPNIQSTANVPIIYSWTTTATNFLLEAKILNNFQIPVNPRIGSIDVEFYGGLRFITNGDVNVLLKMKLQKMNGSSWTDLLVVSENKALSHAHEDEVSMNELSGIIDIPDENSIPFTSEDTLRVLLAIETYNFRTNLTTDLVVNPADVQCVYDSTFLKIVQFKQ